MRKDKSINKDDKKKLTIKRLKWTSNPSADTFLINLDGISDELSDPSLVFAPKQSRINSSSKQIEFVVTRMF